jgi:hypothetical protein
VLSRTASSPINNACPRNDLHAKFASQFKGPVLIKETSCGEGEGRGLNFACKWVFGECRDEMEHRVPTVLFVQLNTGGQLCTISRE